METPNCQICKKRKAYRRITSSIDGSFFVVCKKKECISDLYEMVQPPTPLEEFVEEVRWDEDENQGRSYRKIKDSYMIMDIIARVSVVLLGLFLIYCVVKYMSL
jgi:hypothetical protein